MIRRLFRALRRAAKPIPEPTRRACPGRYISPTDERAPLGDGWHARLKVLDLTPDMIVVAEPRWTRFAAAAKVEFPR